MYLRSIFLPLLFLLIVFQSPQDSLRQHYEAAEAQRKTGNLAAAETEYTALLAEVYGKLGKIYLAQKQYKAAVTALESAVSYNPHSQEVLIDLAIAYFDSAQFQKAFEPLTKALEINPGSVGAHHMLGKTYFMLGNFAKSTMELETALKLAPEDKDIAYTLGLAYLKQRQLVSAQKIYDRMLQQLGQRPQLHIIFGRAYREMDFLPEAIAEFKKAVALDPHFPRAHYYLGLTYLLKDGAIKLNEATDEFRIELTEHPDEYLANYYLAILATFERKWDTAIGFLQKASQIQPNNPDPYFYLGQSYQGLGKYQQAIAALQKSIALNPDFPHNDYQVTNAHFRLGQSLLKVGRAEEGQKELQLATDLKAKAFKRDEAKLGAFVNTPSADEQNKFPQSLTVEGVIAEPNALNAQTNEALQRDAALYAKLIAVAYNNIGLLRTERQDFRAAAEQFQLAAEWDPQLDGLQFNLGLARYKAELYKDAVPPLEKELKDHPANLAAKQLLGLSYFMTDRYLEASTHLTEVINAKPNEMALYYPLALSLIKQEKMDTDRAIPLRLLGNYERLSPSTTK